MKNVVNFLKVKRRSIYIILKFTIKDMLKVGNASDLTCSNQVFVSRAGDLMFRRM